MRISRIKHLLSIVLWLALHTALPSYAQVNSADVLSYADGTQVRAFIEIDGGNRVMKILASGKESTGQVRLVEVGMDGVLHPDTVSVWVQHYQEGMRIDQRSAFADMIIACYPELMSTDARARHVLPGGNGPIYVYNIHHARMVIVSNERIPLLELVLQPPQIAN